MRSANDLINKWHADDADPGSPGTRIDADLFRILFECMSRFKNRHIILPSLEEGEIDLNEAQMTTP